MELENIKSQIENNLSVTLFFLGTCENESDLKKFNPKNGDCVYTNSERSVYMYVNNEWLKAADSSYDTTPITKANKRISKKIPYPSICKNCGAPLHSYTCEFCNTEYPSYEYIIEEEIY